MTSKRCPKCGATKTLAEFHRKRTTKDGLCCWCKECNRSNAREWLAQNRERSRAAARAYGNQHRETRAARSKRWRETHPERFKERRIENRARDRILKTLDNHRRRGARCQADEVAIIKRDPCSYCGEVGGTIDHIVPVIDGGSGDWDNIAGACRSCNSAKGTIPLLRFLLGRIDWNLEAMGVMG